MHSDPRHLGAKVKTQRAMWQHAGDNSATFTGERAGYYLTTSTKSWHRFTLCSGTRGCGGAGRRGDVLNRSSTQIRKLSHGFVHVFLVCNQTADKKNTICPHVAAHMLSAQGSKGHRRRAVHKLASEQATYVQVPYKTLSHFPLLS